VATGGTSPIALRTAWVTVLPVNDCRSVEISVEVADALSGLSTACAVLGWIRTLALAL